VAEKCTYFLGQKHVGIEVLTTDVAISLRRGGGGGKGGSS
jgi:hypothetical protein